jgi:hypothetical protein
MKKIVRLFLVAVTIFVAILLTAIIVDRMGDTSEEKPAQTNQSAADTISTFSALELGSLYANKQASQYEGKIITVTGDVGDQDFLLGQHPYVNLQITQGGVLYGIVTCFLDDKKPQFDHLSRGAKAKYKGMLKGLVGSVIVLENCEAVPPIEQGTAAGHDEIPQPTSDAIASPSPSDSDSELLEASRKTAESAVLQQLGQIAPVEIVSSTARWQSHDDRMRDLESLETAAWSQADVIVDVQVHFANLPHNIIVGCKKGDASGTWATSILQTDIQ